MFGSYLLICHSLQMVLRVNFKALQLQTDKHQTNAQFRTKTPCVENRIQRETGRQRVGVAALMAADSPQAGVLWEARQTNATKERFGCLG